MAATQPPLTHLGTHLPSAAVRLLNTIFSECSIITREKKAATKKNSERRFCLVWTVAPLDAAGLKASGGKMLDGLIDCDGRTDGWMDGRTKGKQFVMTSIAGFCRLRARGLHGQEAEPARKEGSLSRWIHGGSPAF